MALFFFLLSLKTIAPDAPPSDSNYHNYSKPLHRPLPLVLHLPDDQEAARFSQQQHGPLQFGIHALALRPSPEDAATASTEFDASPAARARAVVGDAHRASVGPLPRPVALPALAIAYTLVIAVVRIVGPYDAYALLVVYGPGLRGHRRACKCEYPGTRRRESHDA